MSEEESMSTEEQENLETMFSAIRSFKENQFIEIYSFPQWWEDESKLTPRLRLSFSGSDDKTSVVTVADPVDIMILVERLLSIANRQFESCIPMAEKDMLVFPFPEMVGSILRHVADHLKNITNIAPLLGIDPNAEWRDEDRETPNTGTETNLK